MIQNYNFILNILFIDYYSVNNVLIRFSDSENTFCFDFDFVFFFKVKSQVSRTKTLTFKKLYLVVIFILF